MSVVMMVMVLVTPKGIVRMVMVVHRAHQPLFLARAVVVVVWASINSIQVAIIIYLRRYGACNPINMVQRFPPPIPITRAIQFAHYPIPVEYYTTH